MEVAQHFLSFVQGLENPNANVQHIDPQVNQCLSQIREIVNKLNLNSTIPNLSLPLDLEESRKSEQILVDVCTKIYTELKETLSQLCLMHVYITNFPLHKGNVARFLGIYCQAIFGSSSISIISQSPQAPAHLRVLDGESIINDADHHALVQELGVYMDLEDMRTLDINELSHMKRLLKRRDYVGNVVIRLTKGFSPYYVILHFEQDAPFTGYYMVGKHYNTHPLILNFINHIVDIINTNTFQERKESTLQFIEALTMESIHLKKNFFLSYIASELKEILDCDMPTCLRAEERTHSPGLKKSHSKSVEIVILNNNRFDIHANFPWNNSELNNQLSGIWGKLQSLSKVQEERNYFRAQLKATTLLCLQFSKEGELVYQSGTIPEECWPFVDMDNILQNPKSRYMSVVFGKNKHLLEMVEDTVKGFKESSILSTVHKVEFDGLNLTFICKKNEWSKTVDGFSIVFNDTLISDISNKSIDTMLSDLETLDKLSTLPLQRKVSKRRTIIGRKTTDSNLLSPNVNLDHLRKTIVSEYLPEELTQIPLHSSQPANKSVSAIRTSNLDATPRSAFRVSFERDSADRRTSLFLRIPTKTSESKEDFIFTHEGLEADVQDMEMLTDWSLDVSKIDDVDEKSRLVGVMLNDMNLIKEFNIDLGKLSEFVSRIKDKYSYRKNPYHNYDHGVSVMHATYNIINKMSTQFSSLVNLALLVSAFCHDADHTGRTNMFEVNTSSSLALVYHDRAVLEQHHAAVAFKILNEESCNIFSGIRLEDRKELRKLIISNILATDVKEHFEQMKSFRELSTRVKASHGDFVFSNEDIQVLSGIIIHCADLSGATKEFPVALSWSEKVNREFSAQVKEEGELGIPVTPYFKDLDKKHVMAKQEIAFISFMVKPLWELFCDFCGGPMQVAVNNIEGNLKEWNTRLEHALKIQEDEEDKEKKA